MSQNLQKIIDEFINDTGLESLATAIVDFDGKELAYGIHGTFDKEFNSWHAASVFAMVVNFLDKTLGGIHFEEDEVEEILVTSKNGYFLLQVLKHEECFLGVAVSKEEDIKNMSELIAKYRPRFLE